MSNSFVVAVLGTVSGLALFYLIESFYYEAKARIYFRKQERFIEDLEDDIWDL